MAIRVGVEQSVYDYYQSGSPMVLETPDLIIRSVEEKDRKDFETLFTHPATMAKFTDNESRLKEKGIEIWTKEQLEKANGRLNSFLKRLREKDPFNGFSIINKATGKFEGFVVVGGGDEPGQSEMAYIIRQESWNKTFATQAVTAVVKKYLPALIKVHYELKGTPPTVENGPFKELVATTRQDNIYSGRVLQKVGMEKIGSNEKWGHMRDIYRLKFESNS